MAGEAVGFLLLVGAAIAGGLYTTPMTVVKTGWSFEAIWFLFSLFGLLIFPWITALVTCPDLFDALGAVSVGKLLLTSLFGMGWGIGCQLFGIGVNMVGNSLGFALILGLAATLGSVVPLVILHPEQVGTAAGAWDFAGLGLAAVALVATAFAGVLKERDVQAAKLLEGDAQQDDEKSGSFSTGIVICVLSGVLSACLNFANTFGSGIGDAAKDNGASDAMKTNAIYCISIASGSIPNLLYCGYTVAKKGDWPMQHGGGAFLKNVALTILMGVLWFGSNVAYGAAAAALGDLGTVVGWPIYIIGMVVLANVSGIIQGEWKGASPKAMVWMGLGLLLLCLAIVACGLAGLSDTDASSTTTATTTTASLSAVVR